MPERGIRTMWTGGPPRLVADVCGVGVPIVFLHGVDGTRADWSAQLMAFARVGAALAYDARGHGDSQDYAGPASVADYVADLGRLLDHVAAERAHLVGASTGAAVALAYALRRPERIASLALVCGGRGPARDFRPGALDAFLHARRDALRAGCTPAELGPLLAREQAGPAAEPSGLARLAAGIARLHPESYVKALEAFATHPEPRTLDALAVRTLVLAGEADPYVAPESLGDFAASLRARYVAIAGAGHAPHLERPAEFTAALRAFLGLGG